MSHRDPDHLPQALPNTGPDAPMREERPLTMAEIRDILQRAVDWISDGYEYGETMEWDSELYSGQDIKEDLQRAESKLYILQKRGVQC